MCTREKKKKQREISQEGDKETDRHRWLLLAVIQKYELENDKNAVL